MKRSAGILISALLALGASPASASAHYYPWACSGPISVSGHPGNTWNLNHAMHVWNAVHAGQPHLVRKGHTQVTVQVVHKSKAGWVGLTTWSSPCRARVQLNASTARGFGRHTTPLRRWTIVHELGHVLGLVHTRSRAVMNPHSSLWKRGGRVYPADQRHLKDAYR